jgi:hypothetical protein
MSNENITPEEARAAINKWGHGVDGKVTTAPDKKCPQCGSPKVIWVGFGPSGGYLLCVKCGKSGW